MRFPSFVTACVLPPLVLLAACRDESETRRDGGRSTFFLPTGAEVRNTTEPTVEVGADGRVHAVYPAHALGDAFYATCAADCDARSDVSVVRLRTQGTVANAMLALDRQGRPHVLLSTFLRVYYARCTGDCAVDAGWEVSAILEHGSEFEVTGEAFALAPSGAPRFLMHSYRSFPSGASNPRTFYVTCEQGCSSPDSWSMHLVAPDEIWQESTLRIDDSGKVRVATVANSGSTDVGGYLECEGSCTAVDDWTGTGLAYAYADRWVRDIEPAIAMDTLADGSPRLLLLGRDESGEPNLTYFECDSSCTTQTRWRGNAMVTSRALGAGLDLAVDAEDRVHFVYTDDSDIRRASCRSADCTATDAPWSIAPVERSTELPPDDVILYPNCTFAAWFLRHPSIAIGRDGRAFVAYRAEDVSGGGNPDPSKPSCQAGADMTLARIAVLR